MAIRSKRQPTRSCDDVRGRAELHPLFSNVGAYMYVPVVHSSPGPTVLPREFAHQKALSAHWKGRFPSMKFLTYRILSAVPYDMTIQNQIISHPE